MYRTTAAPPAITEVQLPFPRTTTPVRCRTNPTVFDIDDITGRDEREAAIAKASHACAGCPIVRECLKWALLHPDLTRTGIWAATTPKLRTALRKRTAARLGPGWKQVLFAQEREKERRRRAARSTPPPPVGYLALRQRELELLPGRPEILTPEQQANNRRRLEASLRTRHAA